MQGDKISHKLTSSWLQWLLILAIALGMGFRFLNLDRKLWGQDEAYASLWAAGYTAHEVEAELFQNKFFAAPALQKFQTIRPGSTAKDTIRSLATEDPPHPPLYFLLARGWMHLFGGSILAMRLLPALLSLLSLPLMYLLAAELFASRLAALLAMTLVALSPFDILLAQTAQPYELRATLVIASTLFLVRGLRRGGWQQWGLYTLSVALGLYTHSLFGLTVVTHSFCVVLLYFCGLGNKRHSWLEDLPVAGLPGRSDPSDRWRWLLSFAIAIALALVLYLPWLAVLVSDPQASATANLATDGIAALLKQWTLSFTSLFFDWGFDGETPLAFLARVPFLLLILTAIVIVYRQAPRLSWLITLKTIFVPFLLLALPDLIMGGKRSAVSQDLVASFSGVQLAVAYLLTVGLSSAKQRIWRWGLAIVLAISILSNSQSAVAETCWSKDRSAANLEVAQLINADALKAAPIVVSDRGDDSTHTGDLISLSFRLQDRVRLYLTTQSPNLDPIATEPDVLLFRPSSKIRLALAARGWRMQKVSQQHSLWRLQR